MKRIDRLKARLVGSHFWDVWGRPLEHIECGAHSGFPPCCILWFVTGWVVLREVRDVLNSDGVEYVRMSDGKVSTKNWAKKWKWVTLNGKVYLQYPNEIHLPFDETCSAEPGAGYVRCPWCQKFDVRVEVKSCYHPGQADVEFPYPEETLWVTPSRVKALRKFLRDRLPIGLKFRNHSLNRQK